MATSYSLNNNDGRDTQSFAHSRNLSTLSNSPLLTIKTFDSHPTEPLLRSPLAPIPAGNEDIIPAGLLGTPLRRVATPIAKRLPLRNVLLAFKRQARVITLSLESVMGIWATYNIIRYFLAFLRYNNPLGQTLSLSLAIIAGISAVLTLWAMALSAYILRFVSGQDCKKFHSMLLCLRVLSTLFLLVPATINVVLVFVWRTSSDSDLDLHSRCQLDVDVVWSILRNKCPTDAPSWSLWVALSFVRFLLTASLVTIYLTTSFFTPSKSSHRHSRWLPSDVGSNRASLARITSLTDHHPSDLTLDATLIGDSPQSGLSRSAHSRSFDTFSDHNPYGRMPTRDGEADRETSGFVDRFRTLISQITREVEDTLEAARSDSPQFTETDGDYTSIPKPYHSEFNDIIDANDNNKDNMFNLPPIPMALGYNEFGVPYPPEENIRVMGGFVRRMPTIESMGSDEITSRSSASHRHDPTGNWAPNSRRTTLLTISTVGHDNAVGDPPSRANSLSSRAERLLSISPNSATSEHGELLGRVDHRLSSPSSGDNTFRSLSSGTDDTMSSERTFHTAVMGSSHSATSMYHDDTHVERNT